MANSFNLNMFLKEYQTYGNRAYTAAENGKAAMEQRDIERAQEAVGERSFLSLTLSEKLAELGMGERVLQQFGDTAVNAVKEIVNPFTNYLEKYAIVFDEKAYNDELQKYGKQMYFSKMALEEQSMESAVGQRLVYDM